MLFPRKRSQTREPGTHSSYCAREGRPGVKSGFLLGHRSQKEGREGAAVDLNFK